MGWTAENIPNLSGKTALVTGANSGIGLEAARELARQGAHVVLACRNPRKAEGARASILQDAPGASLELQALDLASLHSVREFAERFRAAHERLDLLINNAGVMALPYCTTADGFEMQLGTNHLGHFALTALVIDRVLAAPGSRIVSVSSNAHKFGRMNFDDLLSQKSYRKWIAYGQSKLANLLFTHELQRRLQTIGSRSIAVACHPGYAATNLPMVGPDMSGSSLMKQITRIGNRWIAQSAAMGALPTLYAATAPDVAGGDYIGPSGVGELRGLPKKVQCTRRAQDAEAARRLWQESERLTGVRFDQL